MKIVRFKQIPDWFPLDTLGMFEPMTNTIWLVPDANAFVLLHELVHWLAYVVLPRGTAFHRGWDGLWHWWDRNRFRFNNLV